MDERIIEIAETPVDLHVKYDQLVIRWHHGDETTIPLSDLAVLVVSERRVMISQSVLSGLVENGGAYLCCNSYHMPAGMLLPIEGNYIQGERIRNQVECPKPREKRLWQSIVKEKIRAQGRLLKTIYGDDYGFDKIAGKVLSGDTNNREAMASLRYWNVLFGSSFRRHPRAGGINGMLNYGYAVLRAIVARAVCAAGLHPSIGIHHHNRYDAFRLADDLMEPMRPLVDKAVYTWWVTHTSVTDLTKESKKHLIEALLCKVDMDGEKRTLFDASSRIAVSLAQAFSNPKTKLSIISV